MKESSIPHALEDRKKGGCAEIFRETSPVLAYKGITSFPQIEQMSYTCVKKGVVARA